MADQYFHLTLGPVQAFVAQARRTRDFWAGSFILSFLSSVAMAAVKQQGGEIQFPIPDENYLDWLENGDSEYDKPLQGSVPNRFKALGARVDESFDPLAVSAAINMAWKALAKLVWQQDIAPVVGEDSQTHNIWQRQINNFWEISWCLTHDAFESNLLDRRKNWRTHLIEDEAGVKCSLMEGYQELSGEERPGEKVQHFWQSLRQLNDSLARDLRADEHLCAIAFVKRRFVHYFHQVHVQLPAIKNFPAKALYGWKLPPSVPSVAYLAATPWLAASILATQGNEPLVEAIENLQSAMFKLDTPWERGDLTHIKNAIEEANFRGKRWEQVNGQFLYSAALDQSIKNAKRDIDFSNKDIMLLEDIQHYLKDVRSLSQLGEPSPFYAVLLMDGDSLGAQMSNPNKQQGISQGLNNFTEGVANIVYNHSGFLVYAGGDDVLALLPQPFAIECAKNIQEFYDECFEEINQSQASADKIFTSISGAIQFAHYKTPLTRILQDAHNLLDDIAKDHTGRNSLAIRLWRPGGLYAQWSAPWSRVSALQEVSQQVANHLQGDLSRSFFFKLEDIIEQLDLTREQGIFNKETITSLVKAAWTHTGKPIANLPPSLAQDLLNACEEVIRIVERESAKEKTSGRFLPDALKLIHFLATENQKFLANPANILEEAVHG